MGAAHRVFEAGNVVVADWHLKQGSIDGRHPRKRRDPVGAGDLPKARDQILAAVALRRCQQHVIAMHPWQQPGNELRVDMEQRQSAEKGARLLALAEHLGDGPGIEDLVGMRAHRNFWRTRRATGAEVGRDRMVCDRPRRDQTIGGLGPYDRAKINDLQPGTR